MGKQTALYESHLALGARMVDFGGWDMPIQYAGIVREHRAVRTAAGLFDISHMGEVTVSGKGAERFLNGLLTNDLKKLEVGRGQYTLLCNERGGVVDDLYAYRVRPHEYLLIVNASRITADVAWIEQAWKEYGDAENVLVDNQSFHRGALALQGPRARDWIARCFSAHHPGLDQLRKNQIVELRIEGEPVCIGCTGYTGEDGFEIVAPESLIPSLWNRILDLDPDPGADGNRSENPVVEPCGLGARDTLRTEVCYPLYGHELTEETTPIEAGVGFAVDLKKEAFVGREVLARQKAEGVTRKCVAFKLNGRGAPPRSGYRILSEGAEPKELGTVTSGTQSPSLDAGIGLGYVPVEFAKPGTPIQIEARGRLYPATVFAKPLYRARPSGPAT